MEIFDRITDRLNYIKYVRQKKACNYSAPIIKWAIIGTGNMANTFAKALNVTPGAKIVAVASRSQGKADDFAKRHGVEKAYGSYEAIYNDKNLDVDILYIATPAFAHCDDIMGALQNGRNVLCEKPIVPTVEELDKLIELSKHKNLFLAEGMWMLCLPVFDKAKEWIEAGRIGRVQKIRVDLSKCENIDYSRAIFDASRGGGVLSDYGVYPIAFAVNFLGDDIQVSHLERVMHSHGFDKDWLIMLTDGSISAEITISSVFNGDRKAVLIGDKGSIVWEQQFNRTNSVCLINDEGKVTDLFHADYKVGGYEYEIAEVQKCISAGLKTSNKMNLIQSRKVVSLIESIKKAEKNVIRS